MKLVNKENALFLLSTLIFFTLGSLTSHLLFGRPSPPTSTVTAGLGENEVGGQVDQELAPNYSGVPLFKISAVKADESVTIRTSNFPANMTFYVTMGHMFTQGIGGVLVGTINSGAGGTITETFAIPSVLYGSARISIRAQTAHANPYYSYNWFYNNTGGEFPISGPMLKYEWSEEIQYSRGGGIHVSFQNPDASRLIVEPTIVNHNQGTRTVTSNIPQTFGTPEAGLFSAYGADYEVCARLYLTNSDFIIDHHRGEECFPLDRMKIATISPRTEDVRGQYDINFTVELVWSPINKTSEQKPIIQSILEGNIQIEVTKPPLLVFGGVNMTNWIFGVLAAVVGGLATNYFDKRFVNTKNSYEFPSPVLPTALENSEMVGLHEVIVDYFSEQELRTLCFNLNVDYDDLPFSGRSNKARELVGLFTRNNALHKLREAIEQERPFVSWNNEIEKQSKSEANAGAESSDLKDN